MPRRRIGQEELFAAEDRGSSLDDLLALNAEVVHDDVSRSKGRHERPLDPDTEGGPSMAPSISIGASIRSWRRPARKVMVLRLPKGA
jgi:hypothetical protein